MEKCPKCSNPSLIKTPHSRIMTEKFGDLVNTGSEHSFDCLKCEYTSGIIRVDDHLEPISEELTKELKLKAEYGRYLNNLPWWKRIFL